MDGVSVCMLVPAAPVGTIALRGTLGGHGSAAAEECDAIYAAIRRGGADASAQDTAARLNKTLEDYRDVIQRRLFG